MSSPAAATEERHATWLELFFDLVIVAAVAQLAHLISEEAGPRDVFFFAVLYYAMWSVWTSFSLYANVRGASTRQAPILAAMFGIAVMAASVPHAVQEHGDDYRVFVVAYVACRLVAGASWSRTGQVMTEWPAVRQGVGVVPWILSLWLTDARYYLWAVGIGLDIDRSAGPRTSHSGLQLTRPLKRFAVCLARTTLRGMTGTMAPRGVRITSALMWLMAPAGLLMIIDGLLEIRWWHTPELAKLMIVFAGIKTEYGLDRPALLRGLGGAYELVFIGVGCLALAALARLVHQGRQWARTWTFLLSIGTFFVGLWAIGTDLVPPVRLAEYLEALKEVGGGARIPDVQALVYPAWYGWAEDLAQGAQVLGSLAVLVALAYAVISHGHYFVRKSVPDHTDQWGAAIRRIREQAPRPPQAD